MKYSGLTREEAARRLGEFGPNALPAEQPVTALRLFAAQFASPLVYILIAVAVISLLLREYRDAAVTFLTVLLNAVFGYTQEARAQRTMTALTRMVVPTAKVIRDGERREVQAAELVPGDAIFLLMGDRVPADGRVLEASALFANEAVMTGESEPVARQAGDEVLMGTVITWGTATVEVTRTGVATRLGGIARAITKTERPLTTLQIKIAGYVRQLMTVAVGLAVLLFVIGLLRGLEFWTLVRMTSVLLIAMMPEALPMAVTLILVIGMRRLLKRQALIRRLMAVETLGSVTVICTDKTGTLTEGKMRVTRTDLADPIHGLEAMCLCNNNADATEVALWEYLLGRPDFQPERFADEHDRVHEIPFDSVHKFMATVNCAAPGECVVYVKGAPEVVLAMSDLTREQKQAVHDQTEAWAREGLRVLALAYHPLRRHAPTNLSLDSMVTMHYAGLVGLWDPPRPEVRDALAKARLAGLKIKVITGDYSHTALKIMENLGLEVGPDGVLDGRALDALDDDALRRRVAAVQLFARVTPQQKLRIVTALQALGEIVTMTGDGVNDAPALKRANIGIVVGSATEVAKETADVVLLDSNFRTIVAAVEEGRVVFENIRKAIFYMLANSFTSVSIIIAAILLGWPLPLTVAQLLWIHLICDGPQDITLGLEPRESGTLADGPKRLDEPILDGLRLFLILGTSLLTAAFAIVLFWDHALLGGDLPLGRTMVFMLATLGSILFIIPSRSFRHPFWRYENFWKNPYLLLAVGVNLVLQAAVISVPAARRVFGLVPLSAAHWAELLGIIVAVILFIETVKWVWKRRPAN